MNRRQCADAVAPVVDRIRMLAEAVQLGHGVAEREVGIVDHEPGRVRTLFAHRSRDRAAVQMYPIAPRPDRVDVESVAVAPVRQIDLLALRGRHAFRR